MKIRFTRDFIIKDLHKKFDRKLTIYNNIINKYQGLPPDVRYIPNWEIYDAIMLPTGSRPEEFVNKINSFSSTLFVVNDAINQFEPIFLRDNYNPKIFGGIPIFESALYSQVFFEHMFSETLLSDRFTEIRKNDHHYLIAHSDINFLIEKDYIFVNNFNEERCILILNTDENQEVIFPEFDDIEVDVDPNYLIDSELIRKLKLQAMTGEAVL